MPVTPTTPQQFQQLSNRFLSQANEANPGGSVLEGLPTTNQPGVPYLGSTSVTPGAGGFTPSTPDYINLLNQLNLQGQQAANVGRIPGEAGLEQQSSGNISQELAGQLPQDVLNLIQQQGAERGVETGSPGSPNDEAAVLAAIGLTSLAQQRQGQQDLSAAAVRNPAAPLVNLTGMLLTPYEAGQLNLRSRESTPIASPAPYTGPGSGGGGIPAMPGVGGPGNSWWDNLFQQPGTPSPTPYAGATDPNAVATQYLGTSLPGFPSLADLLGPQNPYYQPAPLPTLPSGAPPDTGYNPITDQSTYDPFAQYGLGFLGGGDNSGFAGGP